MRGNCSIWPPGKTDLRPRPALQRFAEVIPVVAPPRHSRVVPELFHRFEEFREGPRIERIPCRNDDEGVVPEGRARPEVVLARDDAVGSAPDIDPGLPGHIEGQFACNLAVQGEDESPGGIRNGAQDPRGVAAHLLPALKPREAPGSRKTGGCGGDKRKHIDRQGHYGPDNHPLRKKPSPCVHAPPRRDVSAPPRGQQDHAGGIVGSGPVRLYFLPEAHREKDDQSGCAKTQQVPRPPVQGLDAAEQKDGEDGEKDPGDRRHHEHLAADEVGESQHEVRPRAFEMMGRVLQGYPAVPRVPPKRRDKGQEREPGE